MYFIGNCDNSAPNDYAIYDIKNEEAIHFLFGKEQTLEYINKVHLVPVISNLTIDEAHCEMKKLKKNN